MRLRAGDVESEFVDRAFPVLLRASFSSNEAVVTRVLVLLVCG